MSPPKQENRFSLTNKQILRRKLGSISGAFLNIKHGINSAKLPKNKKTIDKFPRNCYNNFVVQRMRRGVRAV